MNTHEKNIKYLRLFPIFKELVEDDLIIISQNLEEVKLKSNEIIYQEGTESNQLFLILKGKVRVYKQIKHVLKSDLYILQKGDFFGEIEIIEGTPRATTAATIEKSHLLIIDKNDFLQLLYRSDKFLLHLINKLVAQLRSINSTYITEFSNYTELMQSKMEKLHQLVEAARIVNSSLNLDELLSIILQLAVKTVNADRGTLFLLDEQKNELWSKILQGNELVEIRLPKGKGIAGQVAESGQKINIVDAYTDERFNAEIDKITGYHTKSILCVPLENKDGKLIGVLQLLNKKNSHFTDEDEEYINAFSTHACIALENAKLTQEMLQIERFSTVGRMASTIIHDIKNPLSAIRIYAQILQRKIKNKKYSKMSGEIIKAVDRFIAMTQELLDFTRGISKLNLEKVNVEKFIEDVTSIIEINLKQKNISLIKQIEYKGEIVLDMEKMFRAIYNLISNAYDATPEGGTILLHIYKQNSFVFITIKDTGIGMNDDVKSKIFEPFYTYGKKHGTGLGMAIVKRILDDHQGIIEIESELGKGTNITIKLPSNLIVTHEI